MRSPARGADLSTSSSQAFPREAHEALRVTQLGPEPFQGNKFAAALNGIRRRLTGLDNIGQ